MLRVSTSRLIAFVVPVFAAQALAAAPAGADTSIEAICGASPPLETRPSGRSEFQIGRSGRVARDSKNGEKGTVSFFADAEPGSRLLVRVDAVSTLDPKVAPSDRASFCGALDADQELVLNASAIKDGKDVWRLTVYLLRGEAEWLSFGLPKARTGDTWTKLVAKAQTGEERWIYAQALSPILQDGDAIDPENPGRAVEPARRVAEATRWSLGRLKRTVDRIAETYPVAAPGLLHAISDLGDLSVSASKLVEDKGSSSTVGEFAAKWSVIRAKVGNNVVPNAPDKLRCTDAARANLHEAPRLAALWPFGTFELPTTTKEHTIELPGIGPVPPPQPVSEDSLVTAWATYLPPDTNASFMWAAGESTAPDAFKALGGFLAVLASRAPVGTKAMRQPPPDIDQKVLGLTSAESCADIQVGPVPSPWEPLAKYETRARTSATLDGQNLLRDRVYTVYACSGECILTGNEKNIVAKAQARTPAGLALTLLGAMAYDFRLSHPTKQFGDFRWVPTSLSGNTQQVFQLAEVSQPLQSISTTLLLTLLLPECGAGRFGIGGGPSILFGSGSGALKQWTLNLVWAPLRSIDANLTDKIFLTAGVGFRLVDKLLTQNVGDRLVLDRTNQQTPSLPTIATSWDTVSVFSVGLAVDLSVLGDAATAVFGTKMTGASPAASGGSQ